MSKTSVGALQSVGLSFPPMLRHSVLSALVGVAISLLPPLAVASEILAHERYQLGNGLDVILHVDRKLPIVAMNLSYPVGSMHDGVEPGLAHLTEHLMFRGTRDVDDGQHRVLLQETGGSMNATTHLTQTSYFCLLPTNQLSLALWLESNRMAHMVAALDKIKVREEIKTTSDEWRAKVETEQLGDAYLQLRELLFPADHPLHEIRPADIEKLRIEHVREFVSLYHGPRHASLVLAGDLPKDVHAQVERYFGHREGGQLPPTPRIRQLEADGERRVVQRIAQGTTTVVTMAWTSPAMFEAGDAEADVLGTVLDAKLLAMVEQLAPGQFLNVNATQSSMFGASMFSVAAMGMAGTDPEQLLAILDTAWAELHLDSLSDDDLRRAKRHWNVMTLASLQSLPNRAARMQLYIAAGKSPDWLDEDLARYEAVDAKSIAALLADDLHPQHRTVVLAQPAQVAP